MVGRRRYDVMYRRGAPREGGPREELVDLELGGQLDSLHEVACTICRVMQGPPKHLARLHEDTNDDDEAKRPGHRGLGPARHDPPRSGEDRHFSFALTGT